MIRRTLTVTAVAAGMGLWLAGCGGGGGANGSPPASSGSLPATGSAVGLHAAHTALGTVLVDGKGMTVYLLTADHPNQSSCNTSCLAVWPAVPAAAAKPATGVSAKVFHAKAAGNTSIATVGGWPVYTYVGDTKVGAVTGEGITSFGGVWWAVSPTGHPVKKTGSSPAVTTGGSGGNGGYGGY